MPKHFNTPQDARLKETLVMCQFLLNKFYKNFDYVTVEDIKSSRRDTDLVLIRSLISVAFKHRAVPLYTIGKMLGNRTHATVINLLKYNYKKQGRRGRKKIYIQIVRQIKINIKKNYILDKINYHKERITDLKKTLKSLSSK